ncbi:MAG: hypothetical protein ACOH2F_21085, partial [Cellulomonas sp.]
MRWPESERIGGSVAAKSLRPGRAHGAVEGSENAEPMQGGAMGYFVRNGSLLFQPSGAAFIPR